MAGITDLSNREMGQRILKNLDRVQGYLDTLETEARDPHRTGPGTSPEEWHSLSFELRESLENLHQKLTAIDWQDAV